MYNSLMKLAILLPGYIDSPDYLHFIVIQKGLQKLGYKVVRLDPCGLWGGGDASRYSITNYLKDIKDVIDKSKGEDVTEIILVGHSIGGFVSIIAGEKYKEVSKVIALCPPAEFDNPPIKWDNNGYRISERDLPEDSKKKRVFRIPVSFAYDSFTYNAAETVKRIEKPLMILIALEDTIVPPSETEQLVKAAKNPYVVRVEKMGHDFRFSEEECFIVVEKIEMFLKR